jgi:hypothetical protein
MQQKNETSTSVHTDSEDVRRGVRANSATLARERESVQSESEWPHSGGGGSDKVIAASNGKILTKARARPWVEIYGIKFTNRCTGTGPPIITEFFNARNSIKPLETNSSEFFVWHHRLKFSNPADWISGRLSFSNEWNRSF